MNLTLKEKNRKKRYPDTDTFTWYNANPMHHITSDCVIRALSKALDVKYETILSELCELSCLTCYMPNEDIVWQNYVEDEGFVKRKQPKKSSGKKYTAREFAKSHKDGVYLLRLAHHLTACVDGVIYDIWDCGDKTVGNYWEKGGK